MSSRNIYITEQDMGRLRELLRSTKDPFGVERPYLETLRAELDRAEIVAGQTIDADVVTMNSTVCVRDTGGGDNKTLTLVFPEGANAHEDCISVLAPLGAALLGYRVGDQVSFNVPSGTRTCEIVDIVYQPEAAGDPDL